MGKKTALFYSRPANDHVKGIGDDGLMQRYCLYIPYVRIWLDRIDMLTGFGGYLGYSP